MTSYRTNRGNGSTDVSSPLLSDTDKKNSEVIVHWVPRPHRFAGRPWLRVVWFGMILAVWILALIRAPDELWQYYSYWTFALHTIVEFVALIADWRYAKFAQRAHDAHRRDEWTFERLLVEASRVELTWLYEAFCASLLMSSTVFVGVGMIAVTSKEGEDTQDKLLGGTASTEEAAATWYIQIVLHVLPIPALILWSSTPHVWYKLVKWYPHVRVHTRGNDSSEETVVSRDNDFGRFLRQAIRRDIFTRHEVYGNWVFLADLARPVLFVIVLTTTYLVVLAAHGLSPLNVYGLDGQDDMIRRIFVQAVLGASMGLIILGVQYMHIVGIFV